MLLAAGKEAAGDSTEFLGWVKYRGRWFIERGHPRMRISPSSES